MPCLTAEFIERYAVGELADDARTAAETHIAACHQCRQHLDEVRSNVRVAEQIARARAVADGPAWPSRASSGAAPTASTVSASSDKSAWQIPDYERVHVCGAGAYGVVWAVRDRVGVFRALKVIDMGKLAAHHAHCRELTALETYGQRVQRHRNLIDVFHVGVHENRLYYTMELADDERTRKPVRGAFSSDYHPLTLHAVMRRGPVRPDTAIDVVLRLLRGLAQLHAVGLAHRDIKPSNVVFVGRQPKLADIGMVTSNLDMPSQVGTPAYMPPDQRMDTTADVYTLGRILYELLAGKIGEDFPLLPTPMLGRTERWDMIRVQEVIERACADKSEKRYPDARRMLEELEACHELLFDTLFTGPAPPARRPLHPYRPYVLAAIRVLPWALGLILAIVLARKLL